MSKSEITKVTTFKDLIENEFFKIPNYQRHYSWEEEQLKRFFLDLREYNEEYYLGHFLFESKKEERFNIIDGQQRLTTILLFLRSLYETNNNILKKDIYFGAREKLVVINDDRDIFGKLINEDGTQKINKNELTSISQNRMIKAKDYFIEELIKDNHKEQLYSYLSTLESARISCSVFDSKIIANQVFMFHNNRGKGLTHLDQLKSFLINLLNKANKDNDTILNENISSIIEQPFEKIIKSIAKIENKTFKPNEDQILNYHWTVYYGKLFNYTDFEKEYKEKYNLDVASENFYTEISSFTKNLQKSYENILEIVQKAEQDNRVANVLSLGAGFQEYSLLLALSLHNNDWNTDFNKQTLKLMEISLFKQEFTPVNTRSNYFDWLAHQFFTDGKSTEPYEEEGKKEISLLNYLKQYADKGFKLYWDLGTNFVKFFDYTGEKLNNFYSNTKSTKYLLWKYENYLRQKESQNKQTSTTLTLIKANEFKEGGNFTSIEHVYPQNPEDPTPNLGNIVHDIGNLIPMYLRINISLNNKNPKKKYGDMNPADFRHHNEIINYVKNNEWDKDKIIANGKEIKDFALQYFSIYKPELVDNKVAFIKNDNEENIDIVVNKSILNLDSY
jgi:uncharacterized protein with ParB-like and HNH nuclease domain